MIKIVEASVQLEKPQLQVKSTSLTHSIADGSVTIDDGNAMVVIFADFTSDTIRILASAKTGSVEGTASLIPIRTS